VAPSVTEILAERYRLAARRRSELPWKDWARSAHPSRLRESDQLRPFRLQRPAHPSGRSSPREWKGQASGSPASFHCLQPDACPLTITGKPARMRVIATQLR